MKKSKKKHPTLSHLDSILSRIIRQDDVSSLEDGQEYVCPTCNHTVKPCEENPQHTCPTMVKEGTQIDLLEQAETKNVQGQSTRCLRCGKQISEKQLEKNPLAEVCQSCQATAIQRKKC